MGTKTFTIRGMTLPEVDLAIDWAASEGWNPGLYDATSFYAADPKGFLMGLLGKEPVAVVSAVKYNDAFGFMGFYMVKPEYRGMGYGVQMGQVGLTYLAGCTVGLDGVLAQQENYRRSGFRMAYRNVRYRGVFEGMGFTHPNIVPLSFFSLEELCAYDRMLFPADRRAFLQSWVGQPESKAFGYLVKGRLVGYGVARVCRVGYKIGPLFADEPHVADALFRALVAEIPVGSSVFLDVPENNAEAVLLAKRYSMKEVFSTARMYLGPEPKLPASRIFGVTSFELG